LVGAALYIGILPVTDLIERRQSERAATPSPPRER
jgi:hypothetical protein